MDGVIGGGDGGASRGHVHDMSADLGHGWVGQNPAGWSEPEWMPESVAPSMPPKTTTPPTQIPGAPRVSFDSPGGHAVNPPPVPDPASQLAGGSSTEVSDTTGRFGLSRRTMAIIVAAVCGVALFILYKSSALTSTLQKYLNRSAPESSAAFAMRQPEQGKADDGDIEAPAFTTAKLGVRSDQTAAEGADRKDRKNKKGKHSKNKKDKKQAKRGKRNRVSFADDGAGAFPLPMTTAPPKVEADNGDAADDLADDPLFTPISSGRVD